MPRKPRLNVPGGLYHAILRGNGRESIFFDADDRQRWESLISDGINRYHHRIHAYCWMNNHVHLAIQCREVPLSKFMSFVASQYARSTNKKLGRSGHLFERRHRAILVQADSYLKELVRYIHFNPLRAGIVESLTEYQWSSHLAYMTGAGPPWLTLDWVLSAFGESIADARHQYARFMQAGYKRPTADDLRHGTKGDHRVLGDDGFMASLTPDIVQPVSRTTLKDLTREICQKYGVTEESLMSSSRERKYSRIRAEIGLTAIDRGIASNAEIARHFNRSHAGMSRAIDRLRKQAKQVK